MSKTIRSYTSDGAQVLYPIDFVNGFIKREYVYVYLDTEDYTTQLTYTWISDSQIQLTSPVANGLQFHIRRVIPRDDAVNDYQDGAILKEKNLDDSYDQALMILEEVEDGYVTGPSTKIEDLIQVGQGASFVQEARPSDPVIDGVRWYKPSEATTYVWYMDDDSGQWVEENPSVVDAPNRIIPFATVAEATADTSLAEGNTIQIEERANGIFDVVTVGTTANVDLPNTFNIIVSTVDATKCFVLRVENPFEVQKIGINKSSADCQPAWQHLITVMTDVTHAYFSGGGNYTFLSSSDSTRGLTITSDKNTTIDCSDAGYTGNYWTEFLGTLTQIEDLGSNATIYDTSLTFASTPTLDVNDVFVIYNPTDSSWSGFRTTYRAGEFCKAVDITGSVAKLRNPLYDSYATGDVDVYKMDGLKVDVSGLHLKGDVSTNLLNLKMCKDSTIENVSGEHSNNSIILIQRCYNVTINEPTLSQQGDGGDDYAINIGNSQLIRINSGDIYGRRHPINIGGGDFIGSVSCRNVRTIGATLSNDIYSGVHCADFHGNSEDCEYIDCQIYGGATWQGKDNGYTNCNIYNTESGSTILSAEILGGTFYTDNCKHISSFNPQGTGRGIIDIGGNSNVLTADTVEDVTFRVSGEMYLRNMTTGMYCLTFENDGSASKVNVDFSNVKMDTDAMLGVVSTRSNSGTPDSDYMIVDNVHAVGVTGGFLIIHNGSSYNSFPHRLQSQSGSEELTTSTGAGSVTGAAVTFNWTYHKEPVVTMSRSDRGLIGNRVGVAYANPVSTTGLTPVLQSDDNTNFSSASTVDVNWTVGINEI